MGLRDYESVFKAAADPPGSGSSRSSKAGDVRLPDHRDPLSRAVHRVEAPLPAPGGGTHQGPRTGNGFIMRWTAEATPPMPPDAAESPGMAEGRSVVAKDRERAAMARAIGPTVICERKMTLPAGGAGRFSDDRSLRGLEERDRRPRAMHPRTSCPSASPTRLNAFRSRTVEGV